MDGQRHPLHSLVDNTQQLTGVQQACVMQHGPDWLPCAVLPRC